ncbi:hypothetical protein TeGR_g7648 [Tetraparma gracilis]|uniref:Uncharacterized protein n=1 Tax=Tetraparma gracilis TaxID=2962635 RepID=A0ABQ6MXZ1_9STRA|nr:hypothetical protein TeGR_g7648 [Tetraparma gracilis]
MLSVSAESVVLRMSDLDDPRRSSSFSSTCSTQLRAFSSFGSGWSTEGKNRSWWREWFRGQFKRFRRNAKDKELKEAVYQAELSYLEGRLGAADKASLEKIVAHLAGN